MTASTLHIKSVTPVYPRGNYIEWKIQDADSMPAMPWEFVIERSESPHGPWTVVSNPYVVNNLHFFDCIPTHHLHRWWYYRIALSVAGCCQFISKAESYLTPEDHLDNRLKGEVNKMRYDLSILLQRDSGVPVQVFKRRNIGESCPDCTSSVMDIVVHSHCYTCAGTKFIGGYYDPIQTLAKFDAPTIEEAVTVEGEAERAVHQLLMLDVPLLVADDLIFDVLTGELYEVKAVRQTQRKRVIIHQEPIVAELPRSHVAYSLVNNIQTTRTGNETFMFDNTFVRY